VTDLEQRLRRDLKQVSERVTPESVRPLRAPQARNRSRTVRWLAPVAAMVAVIGVVAGVSLAGRPAGQSPAATGPGAIPPYYVTLTGAMDQQEPVITAAVRDSVTGAMLTTVNVPVRRAVTPALGRTTIPGSPPPMPSGVSAAADGRTFVITDDLGLFLLRVAAGGGSARLTQLPIHAAYILSDTAALSPDGTRLAIDVEPCAHSACREGIEVVSLATGASKTWYGPSGSGSPLIPDWTGDGTGVMFLWQVGNSKTPQGYRLLNMASSGDSLLGSSRAVASPPVQNGWDFSAALLTPDGSALITTTYRNIPGSHGGGTAILQVVELSASTGRLLRVLHQATVPYGSGFIAQSGADSDCGVDALAPTGLDALVQCPGLGRLTGGGQFTPLPGIQAPMNPGTGIGGTAAW
jgi:hypothetical protein